jgi:uncharacterized coiled-coil protein SlyX
MNELQQKRLDALNKKLKERLISVEHTKHQINKLMSEIKTNNQIKEINKIPLSHKDTGS